MKRLHNTLIATLLLAAAVGCEPRQQKGCGAGPADIIPAPVEYEVGDGCIASAELAQMAPAVSISERGMKNRLKGQELTDWQLGQAYWLEIGKRGVKVVAADEQGAFYARQTLDMLTELSDTVSCCTILDWPRFQYRGLMLDVSRNFQGKEFIKKQMEMMARLKLNRFHFHLVDNPGWRLQIDSYPRLTRFAAWRPVADFWDWEENETGGAFVEEGTPGAYGGYFTKDDIRELLAYAADRHIEVIPEIEMPGHNYETRAAYPWLACNLPPKERPDAWEICPGSERTYEFLEKVLLEVFELFPSPYVHIGGDEAGKNNWERCSDCQARMKAEGLQSVEELQGYMIRRVERFANEHGKHIIGWDEILEGGLAPDATVMSWRGTEGGLKAIAAGHDVIFTPTDYCYLDYHQGSQYRAAGRLVTLEKVYSFDPLGEDVAEADAHHVLGLQGNLWTEWVHEAWHAEMQLYPRAFAIAETGWSQPSRKDWSDFKRRSDAWGQVARNRGYTLYSQLGDLIPASGASDFSDSGLVQSRKGEYEYVSFTDDGQWTGYRFLGLPETSCSFTVSIQAGLAGGRLEIRTGTPDGPVIATLDIPDTGWKWKERTVPVQGTLSEGDAVYFVAKTAPFSVRSFCME